MAFLMDFYRRWANKYTFIAIFCLCYSLESINYTYLVSALQSLERQFQISSKASGFLYAANDIGYMISILFLSYIGSKGNRAKWIGGGCILIALACLLISTPHFIFPYTDVLASAKPQFEKSLKLMKQPNASLDELLMYPPINAQMQRFRERKGNYSQMIRRDFDGEISSVAEIPIRYDRMQDGFVDIDDLRKGIYSYVINDINVSSDVMQQYKKDSQLSFGYCNPVINSFKEGWRLLKCEKSGSNDIAYGIVFVGIMLIGVGHTLPFTLGIPLLDDNIKRKSVPLYFAGMFFIRMMGPVVGFLVGGACTKIYVTFKAPEGITPRDPRWIGAWWLGFIILSVVLFFPSLVLFLFPKQAAEKDPQPQNENEDSKEKAVAINSRTPQEEKQQTQFTLIDKHASHHKFMHTGLLAEFKHFIWVIGQILVCPVYVGNLIGRCLDVFAWRGFFSYLPKFLHNHYGIPQYQVSLILAGTGIPSFAVGIVGGSFIMQKLKLEGRRAAAFVALGSLSSAITAYIQSTLVCDSAIGKIGTQLNSMDAMCNADCFCDPVRLYPVCSQDGTPFYSPCIAGCDNFTSEIVEATKNYMFTNCSCLPDFGNVSKEFCVDNCSDKIILYFVFKIISAMISGITVITSILMTLRSVPPQHRSIALGFGSFIASAVSNFPSPIVYGAIVDTTCLSWSGDCSGGKGSCLIYDSVQLIFRIHMLKGSLQFLSLIFDAWVFYWAKGLKLITEEEDPTNQRSLSMVAAEAVDEEVVEDIVTRID